MNFLNELLTPKSVDKVVKVAVFTSLAVRRRRLPIVLRDELDRQVKKERIKQEEKEESWNAKLKELLIEDIAKLGFEGSKLCARKAAEYEVAGIEILFSALNHRKIQTVA